MELRVLDLFCGAGGFSEGFTQAGHKVIWAVDNWQPAVLTHGQNHPSSKTIRDDVIRLSKLPDAEFHIIVPDAEIIIGSPPCIAFSNSNKSGKGDKDLGKQLIIAFLRIIARKKWALNSVLKYWILENVPNADGYISEKYSAADLGLAGDRTLIVKGDTSGVYYAEDFGVPSKRKRYFCGEFPKPKAVIVDEREYLTLRQIKEKLGEPYEKIHTFIEDPNYFLSLPGEEVTDHHYTQIIPRFQWEKAKRLKIDKGYMGKMSFPENEAKPARTIMATMTFGARESMIFSYGEDQYRAPTIREVASLMSFPICYRFFGDSILTKYRLVGNAVPPKLALAFGKAIAEEMGEYNLDRYQCKVFLGADGFFNLNEKLIPTPKEKPRIGKSRFRYHIPLLKINQYRVELTNHNSNFTCEKILWSVEIHYSQGKNAQKFTPQPSVEWIPRDLQPVVNTFIQAKSKEIPNHKRLQEIYCLTSEERCTKRLIGPLELLLQVKEFLDSLQFSSENRMEVLLNEKPLVLPLKAAIGYYILKSIVNHMEG